MVWGGGTGDDPNSFEYTMGLVGGISGYNDIRNCDSPVGCGLAVAMVIPWGKIPKGAKYVRIATKGLRAGDELVDLTSAARRSHILDGEVLKDLRYSGGHRAGTGFPRKSEFPAGWSDDVIMHHVSDVATDPASNWVSGRGRDIVVRGTRDGVQIRVVWRNGEIWSAYPENMPRNP
jgi:hypothetical protein